MNVCIDNLLVEAEIEAFISVLSEDKEAFKKLKAIMKSLYASKEQYRDLEALCNEIMQPIIVKRQIITIDLEPNEEALTEAMGEIIDDIAEEESSDEKGK